MPKRALLNIQKNIVLSFYRFIVKTQSEVILLKTHVSLHQDLWPYPLTIPPLLTGSMKYH